MTSVLCVHSGSDLYGSDRSFATCVDAIAEMGNVEIEVLLPGRGPLCEVPSIARRKVTIREFWVLRKGQVLSSLLRVASGLQRLSAAYRDMSDNDITYINTIVVFDYILMARLIREPVVVHVREIPTGLAMRLFRRLLIWSRATLIFNSHATLQAFGIPRRQAQHVVHNGFDPPSAVEPSTYAGERPLRVLVIGRINSWKGQEVVVSALHLLPKELRERVLIRIVGDTFPGRHAFKEKLLEQISGLGLTGLVKVDPFETDPSTSYGWADVVVVPSRLPEPFGRVAIEAMSHGRAVVGSAHGGLPEIVVHNETGLLVPPDQPEELAGALRALLEKPRTVHEFGSKGRARFLELFTEKQAQNALQSALRSLIPEPPAY